MPSTLKRSHRRELVLTRSFESAVKSKVYVSTALRSGWNPCKSFAAPVSTQVRYQYPDESDTQPPQVVSNDSIRSFRSQHFIHALHGDILARVFELGSEDDAMFPVTVACVCRFWYDLALHTPTVWRRISLGPPGNMWQERIRRAKSCSLDIQLRPWHVFEAGTTRPCFLTAEIVQWYMHLVTPFIHRWRSLDIAFMNEAPYIWNAALSGCCGVDPSVHAPLIESVSLVQRGNDDTKQFTLFGGVAPRLRSVTLDGLRLTWLPSLFANLTSLNYTHHTFSYGQQAVSQILSMLEISNQVVRLSVLFPSKSCSSWTSNISAYNECVVLPRLTYLELRVDGPDIPIEMFHMLSQLTTPALCSLHLVDLNRSRSPFPHLRNFLNAPGLPASLCALHMENGWFDRCLFPTLLHAVPRLQLLTAEHQSLPTPLRVDFRRRLHRGPLITWYRC